MSRRTGNAPPSARSASAPLREKAESARYHRAIPKTTPSRHAAPRERWQPRALSNLSQRRAPRLFTEAFTASEIARPPRSFDSEQATETLRGLAASDDLAVVGVHRGGVCVGYPCPRTEAARPPGERLRDFAPAQLVARDASLSQAHRGAAAANGRQLISAKHRSTRIRQELHRSCHCCPSSATLRADRQRRGSPPALWR